VLEISSTWRSSYPGASIGILAIEGVVNPKNHPILDEKKDELEESLRAQFSSLDRASLKTIPVLAAYHTYYKKFKKTYHVQHQLESLVFKNRHLPKVAALVEAMFMAEVKNCMLTAGHDLDVVELPLRIEVAEGSENYVRMNGDEQSMKVGDMMITDAKGIISCIIYGPDRRTCIKPETDRVIFTVYAPPGIDEREVICHLEDIRDNVMIVAAGASVEMLETFGTG
jgi:DNA/RNA-binding domain of Phe-tRNA-synthetase-like protein